MIYQKVCVFGGGSGRNVSIFFNKRLDSFQQFMSDIFSTENAQFVHFFNQNLIYRKKFSDFLSSCFFGKQDRKMFIF